jgi:hypothetical protein
MNTECSAERINFHGLGGRGVVGRFDGGRISSDGVVFFCAKWKSGPTWTEDRGKALAGKSTRGRRTVTRR